MRMEIRTLLFDFDDTLGNREVYAYKAYEEAVDFVKPGMDPKRSSPADMHDPGSAG